MLLYIFGYNYFVQISATTHLTPYKLDNIHNGMTFKIFNKFLQCKNFKFNPQQYNISL